MGWDFEHGDAQLVEGLGYNSFDFVHSSHLLEHWPDCELALKNWWRVLRPGGHLIPYLPNRYLYVKNTHLLSRFNDDQKHFLPEEDDSPNTLGLVPLIERALGITQLIYCKTCNEAYVDSGPELPSDGQYSIEAVIKKLDYM